ncbi:hypothetical protein [Duganella sp. Leaf61]|uniref:hypothetical protein n=1 Tax=Duganella sp. Leaf61 TaxID=1736227 RepID=UPI0012E2809D|nr:hypothetical protein [Duganella sp. Leaf61]
MSGQVGIAMASAAFVGGIALSVYATAISVEDEYWSWVLMLDRIDPVGAAFFIASAGLFFAARMDRLAVISQPYQRAEIGQQPT